MHLTRIHARGYELDSFGHVNHAVYVQYFEHARWMFLKDQGITLETFRQHRRWPVIAEIQIQYKKPVFMNDELEIETQAHSFGKTHFKVSQRIRRGQETVCTAEVTVVMVNDQGKPDSIPDVLSSPRPADHS